MTAISYSLLSVRLLIDAFVLSGSERRYLAILDPAGSFAYAANSMVIRQRYIGWLFNLYKMNPRQTFKNMINTMKLTRKPDREEYKQHLRLVVLGIAVVGAIGFVIQFVFSVVNYIR